MTRAIPTVACAVLLAAGLAGRAAAASAYDVQSYGTGAYYTSFALTDADHDGRLEIVAGTRVPSLEIWDFDPATNGLAVAASIAVPYDVHGVAVGDFDENGKLDLAAGLRFDGLYVALNVGGAWSLRLVAHGYMNQVETADFDRDGHLDLMAATGIGGGGVLVFYGDGHGNFTQGPGPGETGVPAASATGLNPIDVNGDGRVDLLGIVAAPDGGADNRLRACLNTAVPPTGIAWGIAGPDDVFAGAISVPRSVADFDGNGVADVVAQQGNDVVLFRGAREAGGTLDWSLSKLATLGAPGLPSAADVNGDGHADVVVVGGAIAGVKLLLGDGAGGFTPSEIVLDHGLGHLWQGAAAGDVNGDGSTDLVAARALPGRFDLLLRRVLDGFSGPDGELSADWTGFRDGLHYLIHAGGGQAWFGGPIYWTRGAAFGANQTAFVTFKSVTGPGGLDNGLLLKVQSDPVPANDSHDPDWIKGCICVSYNALDELVYVATWRPGVESWTLYPGTPVTMADGDTFGAAVLANGDIRADRNGTQIATFTLNAEDRAFFNGRGGRIGLWFDQAATAEFDDFGGGSLAP